MTTAEVLNVVIGCIGILVGIGALIAGVIAAKASLAVLRDRHMERQALALNSMEEALLFLTFKSAGEEIRFGSYGGGGNLVLPNLEGRCLLIESDVPLKRLMNSELLRLDRTQMMQHGPVESKFYSPNMVSIYRITTKGREIALSISPDGVKAVFEKSNVKGDWN